MIAATISVCVFHLRTGEISHCELKYEEVSKRPKTQSVANRGRGGSHVPHHPDFLGISQPVLAYLCERASAGQPLRSFRGPTETSHNRLMAGIETC